MPGSKCEQCNSPFHAGTFAELGIIEMNHHKVSRRTGEERHRCGSFQEFSDEGRYLGDIHYSHGENVVKVPNRPGSLDDFEQRSGLVGLFENWIIGLSRK